MACASHSLLSAGGCVFRSYRPLHTLPLYPRRAAGTTHHNNSHLFLVRASSDDSDDCNEEDCAPDKEVGRVSVDWLAGEKTRVVGTYPPRNRKWTGYVEKDTAGQTNIYSVEPVVYVAESALSSGSAGTSSEGTGNTVAVVAVLALVSVAVASTILTQVGKNQPQVQTLDYTGPSLTYYINKFKPPEIVEALVPPDQSLAPSLDSSPALADAQQVVALDPTSIGSS